VSTEGNLIEGRTNMNAKRILLAGMVLVLTGACVWGATEISGFTAVTESEAAQIVGGAGYVCDYNHSICGGPDYHWCTNNGNNTNCLDGAWYVIYPRYGCVEAESGECPTEPLVFCEYGACAWDGANCHADGEVYFLVIEASG
jgi:hypothetical protein